jgi:uncharacterized protein YggE
VRAGRAPRDCVRRSAGKAVATLALLVLATAPAGAGPAPPLRSLTVEGTGTVEARPDQAAITLGTRAVRGSAREAQSDAAAAMERVIARLLALGIPRDRIQTVEVRLGPAEPLPGIQDIPARRIAPAYEAVQRVRAVVSPAERAGAAIDAAVEAGAERAGPLEMSVRDPRPLELRALALAVQDADTRARALARAAGIVAIQLMSLETEGVTAPVATAAPMVAATPILPGQVRVVARVRAVHTF